MQLFAMALLDCILHTETIWNNFLIQQQHKAFLCSDQTPDGLLQKGGRTGRRR